MWNQPSIPDHDAEASTKFIDGWIGETSAMKTLPVAIEPRNRDALIKEVIDISACSPHTIKLKTRQNPLSNCLVGGYKKRLTKRERSVNKEKTFNRYFVDQTQASSTDIMA